MRVCVCVCVCLQLDIGVPSDTTKANKYIIDMGRRQEMLLCWVEGFKARFGHRKEAASTISGVDAALLQYDQVVGAARIPLLIANARSARRCHGSVLEYGLDYHLEHFKAAVSAIECVGDIIG